MIFKVNIANIFFYTVCLLYNALKVRLFSETIYKAKENRSRKKNSEREERTE